MNELLIATQKTSVTQVDPYYNLVSLHLKGDVNTGRDYNAFSDASSNNFRLTNNGDVRGSSFSPYGTSWSGFFDGSSTLSIPGSATNDFGSSDFTVEFFWYVTNTSARQWLFHAVTDWWLGIDYNYSGAGANKLSVYASSNGTSWDIFNGDIPSANGVSTGVPTPNIWNHIALCRVGSAWGLFLNGVRVWTGSSSASIVSRSGQVKYIGSWAGGSTYRIYGYLSNFRQVVGNSVYNPSDATLIVPTSPLAASGTNFTGQAYTARLLICHTNRFIDRDGAAGTLTVTRNGDTRISSFSPFLDSDTTTGSGYFDGTGDYLSTTANLTQSGNFTIECWVYITKSSGDGKTIINIGDESSGRIVFYIGTSNEIRYGLSGVADASLGGSIANNVWTHIAIVRLSTTVTAYVNGTATGTTATISGTVGNTNGNWVGSFATGSNQMMGYISSLRVVTGTAVYTGNFTPPTAPLTATQSGGTNIQAITGTQTALLTLQERGAYNTVGFQDESEYQHVITRPSGANVAQGTFSPFSNSGWSNYFNGSSYLIDSSLTASVTGDFTLEFWWYPMDLSAGYNLLYGNNISGSGTNYFGLSGTTWVFNNGSEISLGSFSYPANNWYHIALVRSSGNLKVYVNGTGGSSYSSSATWAFGSGTTIGSFGSGFIAKTCYLSNVRLVNGQALFTGNFTPGTSALTATTVGHTGTGVVASLTGTVSVLTCQSNRFRDASTNNFTITTSGSPTVVAFSPFKPPAYDPQVHGGSAYFDDNGDYLSVANHTAFKFGTGDFTVEGWFYLPVFNTSYDSLFTIGNYTDGILMRYQNVDATNDNLYIAGSYYNWGPIANFKIGAWNHVAVVRNGSGSNNLQVYVNGVSVLTATNTSNLQPAGSVFIGTAAHSLTDTWGGYISSFRIIKGTAVYTSNFVPPSGPLPLLGNTSLLLNFTNGGVIDSTGKNVIETVGNAGVVTTSIKKYGSGSMFFDGTGDYLQQPLTNLLSFAENTYTIEAWIYPTTSSGYRRIFSTSTSAAATVGYLALVVNGTSLVGETRPTNNGAVTTISGGTVNANTWYHAALSVNNGSARLFLDGVQVGSTTSFPALAAMNYVTVGAILYNSGASTTDFFTGYIDDLRITKGYARYVEGTGANAGKMVFNGTNTLALPTKAHPDSGVLSTLTTSMVAPSTVDYLVVGGGGGGGRENFSSGLGGGGGAGGFITGATTVSAATNYVITVGGGGPGLTAAGTSNDGFPSSIVGGTSPSAFTIPGVVAAGGGGGGGGTSPGIAGRAGGSGGGGGTPSPSNGGAASPAGQGNAGGPYSATSPNSGGGGGGAGEAGNTDGQGEGGDGTASSISGSLVTYAGGGGGGASFLTKSGGLGGGGDGGNAPSGPSAQPGGTNTGGGGGGGFNSTPGGTSGAGGSGIVIIAYPSTFKPLKASLGLVYTIDTVTRAGYRVYKFVAGTGTISW